MTATGIAHKISFAPAPLDFGSGLLVLREQCNKMGTCGLGTEKVGLPIEKALTVKNEGSVSVTLTLSTSAPYQIVSVPPTLSPGQSAPVTVRFDPSESGSFAGSVQVGISGGQGSVSSPPLVGVAHKIEIDPAELDFGIVFVGSTRERKLTIKNQGMTTVPLTVSVGEPFRIVSGGSFTLTPSETGEVTVQLSPATSGPLAEGLRLSVESNNITTPIIGAAYTKEEFEEAVYQACQVQEQENYATLKPQILFYRDPSPSNDNINALFYGLPCLTPEQLRHVIELIEQDNWNLPDLDPALEQVQWDKQNVYQAIQFLLGKYQQSVTEGKSPDDRRALVLGWIQLMITPGSTHYNPDFAAFHNWLNEPDKVSAFLQRLMTEGFLNLLGSIPGIGPLISMWQSVMNALQSPTGQISPAQAFITLLVATMHTYAAQGAPQTVQALLQNQNASHALLSALQAVVVAGTLVEVKGDYEAAGLTLTFYAGFLERLRTASTLSSFTGIIGLYLQHLAKGPNNSLSNPSEDYANHMGGFMALVNLIENGWQVKTIPAVFGALTGYCPPGFCLNIYQLVHVIASKNVEGIGLVTAFVHVQAKLGSDEVDSIVSNINRILRDVDTLNRSKYTVPWHGSYPVVVQVSFSANTSDVNKILNRLGTPSVPVVFVYVDQNGVWQAKAACPVGGCPGGLSPEEFARRIAEAMGYPVGKKYDPLTDLPSFFWWWLIV